MSSASRDRIYRKGVTLLFLGLFAGVGACDKASVPEKTDSTVAITSVDSTQPNVPEIAASTWDAQAGPFVVLPTVDGGMSSGSVLRPNATDATVGDTTGLGAELGAGTVDLFSRSGLIGTARLRIEKALLPDLKCTAWPVARLVIDAGLARTPWAVAFASGHVKAVALDSIEGLSPRDSARMAVDLTRLGSALPDDTVATFRGLPFVVFRAFRTRGLETEFIVATLVRRLNQEDSPREERLIIVVDVRGADSRDWKVAWSERASGREDELVVAEPLLAYQTQSGASRATENATPPRSVQLLFGRDDGVALGAAVLSRDETGWHVQWESAIAGCM